MPETLGLLADLGLGYVVVDAPQVGTGTTPLVPAVTDPDIAYVRLHGRNTRTWYSKTATTGERFDYLYSGGELAEWVPRVRDLAERAAEVHVLFNNHTTTSDGRCRSLPGEAESCPVGVASAAPSAVRCQPVA